jgi:hypothetical protein
LALSLPEFTRDRLLKAGLLLSIAPTKEFSKAERRIVRDFVEQGGLFIATVGYEERRASAELLADFGFEVGRDASTNRLTTREPQPLGHFKVPYLDTGEYKSYVRYWASWPVGCTATNARVIAYGHHDVPVIVQRSVGRGQVVVIGDRGFALNKNLEREDGQPIEGRRENAHFWRWLLTTLRDQPRWIPPPEPEPAAPAAGNRRSPSPGARSRSSLEGVEP